MAQQVSHLGRGHGGRVEDESLCPGPRMEIAVDRMGYRQEAEDIQSSSQRRLDRLSQDIALGDAGQFVDVAENERVSAIESLSEPRDDSQVARTQTNRLSSIHADEPLASGISDARNLEVEMLVVAHEAVHLLVEGVEDHFADPARRIPLIIPVALGL
jgi:hypothetical protein